MLLVILLHFVGGDVEVRTDFALDHFFLQHSIAQRGFVTVPRKAVGFNAFLQIFKSGQAVLLANFIETLVEFGFDFDAHVFGALNHEGLIDHAAQQIFLLFFELGFDFFGWAGFAVARDFVAELLFGFLVVGESDGFVVHAGHDFGGGLRLRLGRPRRENQEREERNERYGAAILHGVTQFPSHTTIVAGNFDPRAILSRTPGARECFALFSWAVRPGKTYAAPPGLVSRARDSARRRSALNRFAMR